MQGVSTVYSMFVSGHLEGLDDNVCLFLFIHIFKSIGPSAAESVVDVLYLFVL